MTSTNEIFLQDSLHYLNELMSNAQMTVRTLSQ